MHTARHVVHWLPFAFCTILVMVYIGLPDSGKYLWIWLPMVFFYVGATTHALHKRLERLETALGTPGQDSVQRLP